MSDTDNPPNIPAFSTFIFKKTQKDTLADAMEGEAVAFANVVSYKDDTSGKKEHICSGDLDQQFPQQGKLWNCE